MNLNIKSNLEDYNNAVASFIFDFIERSLKEKERVVISLPTENECAPIYKMLASKIKSSSINLSKLYLFQQTEYMGLSTTNKNSSNYFLTSNFISLIDIPKENVFLFNGLESENQMDKMTLKLKYFGVIDLIWYSLTQSSKVAGNERLSSINALYRLKTIDTIEKVEYLDSLDDNYKISPTRLFSMGMGFLSMTNTVLLTANGVEKSEALKECLEGGIGHTSPVSLIQQHKDVFVIADKEATLRLDSQIISLCN